MRFFLKVKQNGKQVGLKRIEIKQDIKRTDDLIQFVEKSIGLDNSSFILKQILDNLKLRITAGWDLTNYSIRSGAQFEVQVIKTHRSQLPEGDATKEGETLFNKQQMVKIIEQEEQDEKSQQISSLIEIKYQELLKKIQKNQTAQYLRDVKAFHSSLGPCENEFYCKELISIQNQLGARGWGAIHYAVFAGNKEIVNFLIEIGVDLNNMTSDGWLPIQLAIRQENIEMVQILAAQPMLNLNICTAHGLVLFMAIQSLNRQCVKILLRRQINLSIRDHLGRSIQDMIALNPDQQICSMLQKEEQRQSLSSNSQQNQRIYHALVSLYRGGLILVRTPPFKNKDYYLVLNPYESCIKFFDQKSHYPQFPKQLIPLSMVLKFQELPKSDRSWYMKPDLFYILIATPKNKYIMACNFQPTFKKWLNAYIQCQQHTRKYAQSLKLMQRNQCIIIDRIEKEQEQKKKTINNHKTESLMNLFTSRFSQKSEESPQKKPISQKSTTTEQTVEPAKQFQKNINQQNQGKGRQVDLFRKVGVKFQDFRILKTLGQGSFGTVFLAMDLRNPERKKQYALKCFKKKKLVVNKQIKYTIAELNILKQLEHPFIVNLHFTFQTPNYVYLGLDYCPNKDLSHHLMSEVTFQQKDAAIYTAEILLALEYMHEKNIIYRDLKPENIMLDQQGHVRLVDFGLSKQGTGRQFVAKSFCGSPAYLSPQMLIKKGVGRQSDLYCLGAVLYEMIVGQPPFFSDDIITLYKNITSSKLTFPKSVSNEAKSLLVGLLQRDPHRRLGSNSIDDIKRHSFFKDINWGDIIQKKVKAPLRQIEQQEVDPLAVHSTHKDFDYSVENHKINRFLNFSFIREEQK